MQFHDLAGDIRTDLHLCFGLYLSVGGHGFNNRVDSHLFGCHLYGYLFAEPAGFLSDNGQDKENDNCSGKDFKKIIVFHRMIVYGILLGEYCYMFKGKGYSLVEIEHLCFKDVFIFCLGHFTLGSKELCL